MAMHILYFLISLINSSEFGGLPVDASVPGLAYSVTGRCGFPNVDNVSSFAFLTRGGLSLSFAYVPESIRDILNYGTHAKFKNLTAVGFYSKGAAFFYRLINRREVKSQFKETEFSIDEFSLAVSDLIYYNLYGGLRLNYYYVRYGEAAVINGIPEVNLDTGNGFSVDLGLAYRWKGICAGVSVKNAVSGIYYSKFSKDVLNPSGSAGISFEPLNFFSLSLDGFMEKNGKPYCSSALKVKPLKWVEVMGGYTFNEKSYGIGVELHYKGSDFIISYWKKSAFLTWRYVLE